MVSKPKEPPSLPLPGISPGDGKGHPHPWPLPRRVMCRNNPQVIPTIDSTSPQAAQEVEGELSPETPPPTTRAAPAARSAGGQTDT